jgi:hypothetical protein
MAIYFHKTQIELTYKDKDVEEFIDIYFFRPFGYLLALSARSIKLTPNTVTIIGMITGVISGHLFYYSSMTINMIGIFVKIFSNALDSADGQLARMTHSESHMGRILDGISSHVIFLSIYIHLCLRYIHEGHSKWIFAVAILAGASHFIQAAWGDFYRNGYLYFVRGPKFCEIGSSDQLLYQYQMLKWKGRFINKFIVCVELKYILSLQMFTKSYRILKTMIEKIYRGKIPSWLSQEYRRSIKPMNKYYNMLTINVRQFTLFALLLLKKPELFFIFELVALNIVFIYAAILQENKIKHLISIAKSRTDNKPNGEKDREKR